MMRFEQTKISNKKFSAAKNPVEIWDVNADNIFISKLVKRETNAKHLTGYSDKDMRPLVLIIPKTNGYVKTLKVEDKKCKLISFHINDEKILEKFKTICTKIECFISL